VDHVLLRVSDLDKSLRYYEVLYGPPRQGDRNGRVYFDFPASNTSLQLEQADYRYGDKPRIAHFGVKVDAFDRQQVEAGLSAMGATVLASPDESSVLRFNDIDGNIVELVTR
jgi:catechol 2,3-dioxygenase-like lactoylglutathione lyase family enzyme